MPCEGQALEAGRVMEAEEYVLEAHMERGYDLEAPRQNAEHSWNRSLGQVEQPTWSEGVN